MAIYTKLRRPSYTDQMNIPYQYTNQMNIPNQYKNKIVFYTTR